ncbi:MAG: hypothetical protein WC047_00175 [Kiritimatiellales bacterium]
MNIYVITAALAELAALKADMEAGRLVRVGSNRALTLEELDALEEPTPVYVKHRYGAWQQDGWHIWSPFAEDRDCELYDTQNYGITWEAWIRRPTDE